MTAAGIMVGPVDHTAAIVPLKLAVHRDQVAFLRIRDARGEVDVVGDQHGAPIANIEQQALVLRAFGVVRQHPFDAGGSREYDIAALSLDGPFELRIVGRSATPGRMVRRGFERRLGWRWRGAGAAREVLRLFQCQEAAGDQQQDDDTFDEILHEYNFDIDGPLSGAARDE